MNHLYKLILYSFVHQQSADDCGASCLQMVLNFAGIGFKIPEHFSNTSLSLLELHQLSSAAGLRSRPVRMDTEHLRTVTAPCILHVLTNDGAPHFIVCYAYDPKLSMYLIADPDRQVSFISEDELSGQWQSRAALYFEDITPSSGWKPRFYPWLNLSRFNFVPGVLWFAIPFLNAFGTLLGLGATLIIEKAVNPKFMNGGLPVMAIIFALLFSLSAARCMINFLKEKLIINFAGKLDGSLYRELTMPLERTMLNTRLLARRFTEKIRDVQRIHQAASLLIGGILCDGLLLLAMLISLYLYFPVLVLPEALVVVFLLFLADRQLPWMLITYQSGDKPAPQLKLAGSTEHTREEAIAHGIESNAGFSRKAMLLSAQANRLNLYFDAITSINLIMVLAYGLIQLQGSTASYQEFILGIVLCYVIVGTGTKICNQLFLVAHGAGILGKSYRS